MANPARIKIGLLAALCLVLIAAAYLIARPAILNERAIRIAIVDHLTGWTGAKVTVRGPARLSYFPRLMVETGEVHVEDIAHLPSVRNIRSKAMRIRLGLWSLVSGSPVIDRVTLVEPEIEAVTRGATAAAAAGPNGASRFPAALAAAPFEKVALERGSLTVTGPERAETFTNLDLKVNLRPGRTDHSGRGAFVWRDRAISFLYDAGTSVKTANAIEMPLTLTLAGDLVSAEITGKTTVAAGVRFDGNVNLTIPNLARLARWTGVLVPEDQRRGNFTASGTFHWAGSRIGFDQGTFVLDGNRALGALALDVAGPRPRIDGTLALQRLNLTQYFEPAGAPVTAPGTQPAGAKAIDVGFPVLHHINFDLRISTTELIAAPLNLGQSALSVTLDSGRLAADIAVFDLCGGNGNGRLEFDATVPDTAMRLSTAMTGFSARACIEIFTPSSPLEGTATVTADLTSKGRTGPEILEALRGKVKFAVSAGQADVDLARLVASVRTGPVTGWPAARGSATAFKLLQGNIFFRHNGVYADSLKIDLGSTRIAGEGTIDLSAKALDMRMSLKEFPASATAQDGEKPVPVRSEAIVIKGPWSAPTFSPGPPKSSAHMSPRREGRPSAVQGNL